MLVLTTVSWLFGCPAAALQTGVEDPFTRQRAEKRERVKKQEKQQLANLKVRLPVGLKGAQL